MKFETKLQGVDDVVNMLHSLPAEVVSARGGPVKASLAKGARFLRDRARERLRAVISGSEDSTGLLVQNVVATRGKAPSSGKGERYLVRVRRRAYDGGKLGKRQKAGARVTTHKTAALLEYGSSHQPATPWLRPAVENHGAQVISVVTDDLLRQIAKTASRLKKGGA